MYYLCNTGSAHLRRATSDPSLTTRGHPHTSEEPPAAIHIVSQDYQHLVGHVGMPAGGDGARSMAASQATARHSVIAILGRLIRGCDPPAGRILALFMTAHTPTNPRVASHRLWQAWLGRKPPVWGCQRGGGLGSRGDRYSFVLLVPGVSLEILSGTSTTAQPKR